MGLFAALQGIFALLETAVWIRLVATMLVAALAVASEADKLHTKRVEAAATEARAAEEARTTEREWQRRVDVALRWWPPTLLTEIDPYKLGIWHSLKADIQIQPPARLPPYVPRDVHQRAKELLRARGTLLVIGQAASGMTRTAFEVVDDDETPRVVLAPGVGDGLRIAIDQSDVLSRMDRRPPLLVWLDRIERFSDNDVLPGLLRRCLDHAVGGRVVATISATTYRTWSVEHRDLAEMFEHVTLDRLPSQRELQLAGAAYPGVDFTEGIAAAFTTTASLLKRMRTGHPDCPFEPAGGDCTLARPLVETVFAWINTGTTRALPVSLLSELLQQRPGLANYVDPDHVTAALDWATGYTIERAALISRDDPSDRNGVDDTVEVVQPAPSANLAACLWATNDVATSWEPSMSPSAAVWTTAITEAFTAGDSDSGGRVGFTAHIHRSFEAADRAWSEVTTLQDPAVNWIQRAASFSESAHDARAQTCALEHLLRLRESALGPDHPGVADTLSNLGDACYSLGKADRARSLFQRALIIEEREYGPDHPKVATSLVHLGYAWYALGEPARARALFERALTIDEREYGFDHPKVAAVLLGLGDAWRDLGEPDRARDLLERALTIDEWEYGPDHPEVAAALVRLGGAWRDLGEPDRARGLLERALTIEKREFGPDHPKVANTLVSLGGAWFDLGKPDRALSLFQRALTIEEREFGPDHPWVANTLVCLGNAWAVLGEPARARDLHQRGVTIEEREFGPDHPKVANALSNLGASSRRLGEPARARDLHQRALTIREGAFGPDHPEVAITLSNLGNAWFDLGEPDRARDLWLRALRIMQVHYPNGHPVLDAIRAGLRSIDPDLIVLDDGATAEPRDPLPPNTSTGSL